MDSDETIEDFVSIDVPLDSIAESSHALHLYLAADPKISNSSIDDVKPEGLFEDGLASAAGLSSPREHPTPVRARQAIWRILGRKRDILELRIFGLTTSQEPEPLGERPLQLHLGQAIIPNVLVRSEDDCKSWEIVIVTVDGSIHRVLLGPLVNPDHDVNELPPYTSSRHCVSKNKIGVTKVIFTDSFAILAFQDGSLTRVVLPSQQSQANDMEDGDGLQAWDELEFRQGNFLRSVRSLFFSRQNQVTLSAKKNDIRPQGSDTFLDLVSCDDKIWGLTASGSLKVWHAENGAPLKTHEVYEPDDGSSASSSPGPALHIQVLLCPEDSQSLIYKHVIACYDTAHAIFIILGVQSDDFGAISEVNRLALLPLPGTDPMQAFSFDVHNEGFRLWLRTDATDMSTFVIDLEGLHREVTSVQRASSVDMEKDPTPLHSWRQILQERPSSIISLQDYEGSIAQSSGDASQAGLRLLTFPGRFSTTVIRSASSGILPNRNTISLQRDELVQMIYETLSQARRNDAHSESEDTFDEITRSWMDLFGNCTDLCQREALAVGVAIGAFNDKPIFLSATGLEVLEAAELPFSLGSALVTSAAHRFVSTVLPDLQAQFDDESYSNLDFLFLQDRRDLLMTLDKDRWDSLAAEVLELRPNVGSVQDLIEPHLQDLNGLNSEDIDELILALSPMPLAPEALDTVNIISDTGRLLIAKRLHLNSVHYLMHAKRLLLGMLLIYADQGNRSMILALTEIARVWHSWYVLKTLLESTRLGRYSGSKIGDQGFLFSWLKRPSTRIHVVAEVILEIKQHRAPINALSQALLSDLDIFQQIIQGLDSRLDRPVLFAKSIATYEYGQEALTILDLLPPSHFNTFARAMAYLVEGEFDRAGLNFRQCAGHISRTEWDADNAIKPLDSDDPGDMIELHEYYRAVSELFEDLNDLPSALRFAQVALNHSTQQDDKQLCKVFDCAINLGLFDDANEALLDMSYSQGQVTRLRELIEVSVRANYSALIFDSSFGRLHDDLDRILFELALECSLSTEPNYISLCYAYRINVGNMRSAAELMTRFARRTVVQARRQNERTVDLKLLKCADDMYTLAINALGLVSPDDQWVMMSDCEDAHINRFQPYKSKDRDGVVRTVIISLAEIMGERAYIQLIDLAATHVPGDYIEDVDTLLQLASLGSSFDRALDLAAKAGAEFEAIFATMANTCSDLQYEEDNRSLAKERGGIIHIGRASHNGGKNPETTASGAWFVLHERLKALDDPSSSYPGYRATLDAVMKSSRFRKDTRSPDLVPWLINHFLRFDPGYLINSFIKEGWIEDSAKFCLQLVRSTRNSLNVSMNRNTKTFTTATSICPEYGVIDRVLWAINQVTSRLSTEDEIDEKMMFEAIKRDIVSETDALMKLIRLRDKI